MAEQMKNVRSNPRMGSGGRRIEITSPPNEKHQQATAFHNFVNPARRLLHHSPVVEGEARAQKAAEGLHSGLMAAYQSAMAGANGA